MARRQRSCAGERGHRPVLWWLGKDAFESHAHTAMVNLCYLPALLHGPQARSAGAPGLAVDAVGAISLVTEAEPLATAAPGVFENVDGRRGNDGRYDAFAQDLAGVFVSCGEPAACGCVGSPPCRPGLPAAGAQTRPLCTPAILMLSSPQPSFQSSTHPAPRGHPAHPPPLRPPAHLCLRNRRLILPPHTPAGGES